MGFPSWGCCACGDEPRGAIISSLAQFSRRLVFEFLLPKRGKRGKRAVARFFIELEVFRKVLKDLTQRLIVTFLQVQTNLQCSPQYVGALDWQFVSVCPEVHETEGAPV